MYQTPEGIGAYCAVGSFHIVTSSPRFHLLLSVFQEREPVLVQTLLGKTSLECLDDGVVCGFPGQAEVQFHSVQVSPRAIFAAARLSTEEEVVNFRIDYTAPSRAWTVDIPRRLQVSGSLALSECTAVGYTTKRFERWARHLPELGVECVGVPPYPGDRYPRVLGVLRRRRPAAPSRPRLTFVYGDATEPRQGPGHRVIAHIVNDKTPNWGAGFAREVKIKWNFVQQDFRRWADESSRNLSLANTHITDISDDLNVVHMVAQRGYGPSAKPRIRYAALRQCLEHLAEIAVKRHATVHMPRIGSGQAGGHWGIIQELIDDSLVWRGVDVTIYDLPGAEPPKEVQGLLCLGATHR